MKLLRICFAFVGGMWLYYAAAILVGGTVAAVTVPKGYFDYFGNDHKGASLVLLSLILDMVPVAVIVCGGFLALHRILRPLSSMRVSLLAVFGMISCFMYWGNASETSHLWSSFRSPWWSIPSFLAPWLGAGLAMWLEAGMPKSSSDVQEKVLPSG